MKKQLLLFILALLCVPLARGQSSFQNPLQGPITATSAACATAGDQSCVWQKLALAASVATVQVSGTFSATLTVEANNGGANFTTLGTITTAGTTSYVVAGFTDFRVRASAYTSGTAFVTINSSPAPSGGVTSGTADPTGNACSASALFVQTTSGNLYTCKAGVFALAGGSSSGTVTSVSFTGGLISVATPTTTPAFTVAGTSGGIPYFSGAATWASSAAGTVNTLMKWGGAGNPPIASSVTDNGTTVVTTEPFSSTGVITSGANGGTAGGISFNGSTSGTQTCTTATTAATLTCTGTLVFPTINPSSTIAIAGRNFVLATTPTIATGGCGGSGATISNIAGTAAFDVNVGTGPTSAGCVVTMPGATTTWACQANDFTTISATVLFQKQTASSTTSITIKTFDATATAQAPVASDIYHVTCTAH